MSDLTRAEAIKELTEHLNHWERLLKEGICGKEQGERTIKSLELAIDSLKVDEAYKLMYEKVDFIEIPEGATRRDLHKLVFGIDVPELHSDKFRCAREKGCSNCKHKDNINCDMVWWNSPYRKEQK